MLQHIPEAELDQFKREAYRNAIRLFRDACHLYGFGSYASAYGLAALAYEELGKVLAIEHACDAISLNRDQWQQIYRDLLGPGVLRDHVVKQETAYVLTNFVSAMHDRRKAVRISHGSIDRTKQEAFYVEMVNEQVLTPARVSIGQTFGLLQDVLQGFEESGDVGFSGSDWDQTPRSEWETAEQLAIARAAMEECVDHNRTVGFVTK